MAQFIFNKVAKELLVAANQKVIILNLIDQKVKQVIVIPENLFELIHDKNQKCEDDDDEMGNIQQNNGDKLKNLQLSKITIQNIAISPNGKYLAISTGGVKSLILYCQKNSTWDILSIRKSNRASSAITFSPNSEILLLCDRSGDCFLYDCEKHLLSKKWILGHLSSIFDVKFSSDGKYILTADRDEKVRVTNFPDSYEIENYCLGHKEYICSIEILEKNPELLVSLSGDKTLRIWIWKEGIQLAKLEIPAPGVKMAIKSLEKSLYEISIVVFQPNDSLYIYSLDVSDINDVKIQKEKSICLESAIATSIAYIEKSLIASTFINNKLQIEFVETTLKTNLEQFLDIKHNIENQFVGENFQDPEDISNWFKKKFDNVSEYLQRKRQRIEEKNTKRKQRC